MGDIGVRNVTVRNVCVGDVGMSIGVVDVGMSNVHVGNIVMRDVCVGDVCMGVAVTTTLVPSCVEPAPKRTLLPATASDACLGSQIGAEKKALIAILVDVVPVIPLGPERPLDARTRLHKRPSELPLLTCAVD